MWNYSLVSHNINLFTQVLHECYATPSRFPTQSAASTTNMQETKVALWKGNTRMLKAPHWATSWSQGDAISTREAHLSVTGTLWFLINIFLSQHINQRKALCPSKHALEWMTKTATTSHLKKTATNWLQKSLGKGCGCALAKAASKKSDSFFLYWRILAF